MGFEWLIIGLVGWLELSGLIILTSWLFVKVISFFWPEWWRQYVVDDLPRWGLDV